MQDFYNAMMVRRSNYTITDKSDISDDRIISIVMDALTHVPSPFNSHSGRVAVLLGDNHKKLWNIVLEVLKAMVPESKFAPTEQKIASFAAGYGTVLFFEDQSVVKNLEENFPAYKDKFGLWSAQSNGMLEYIVWTSFAIEGLGASLQHYNPIIDDKVREAFNIPGDWHMYAQMPFGKPSAPAGDKTFIPAKDRMIVLK